MEDWSIRGGWMTRWVEDARRPGEPSFIQGTVWTAGMVVETRVLTTTGQLGPWVSGRLNRFGKCGGKIPDGTPWSARPVDCFVLLLTRDGSHGLDLSALTHIFLADQVWDPAVEHQVVSRAYRMGATGPVTVSQLLMRGTLEETLHQMVTGAVADDGRDEAGGSSGSGRNGVSQAEAEAPHTPSRSTSAKVAGKRRLNEAVGDDTPPTKRAPQEHGASSSSASSADASHEQLSVQQGSSSAAQEEAKVHSLLKSIRFLR